MSDDWPQGWYRGGGNDSPRRASAHRSPGLSARESGRGGWPDAPGGRAGYGDDWGDDSYGGSAYGRGGGRSWRRSGRGGRRFFKYLMSFVLVIIVLLVVAYFYYDGKLHRTVTLPETTATSSGTNWLITGSDSRDGLSRTQRDALHVGSDMGTLNSDSIMLLHLGGPKPVLLSIPRDSYVPIPGHGHNKLNAALGIDGGSPKLLIETIESVTGLKIDHYMGIGFGGLVKVTNAVGGVRMCLPSAVNDSFSGVHLQPGCQNLNGPQALSFVRDRHSFATGDLQRIQDQRAFLNALLKKATSPAVFLNPFRVFPFASSAADATSVDQGTHLINLVPLAFALKNPESGTVPISDPAFQTSAGEAVKWDSAKALQLFNALKDNQAVPAGLLEGTKLGKSLG